MVVKTDFAGLTTTRWHEYAIRFAVGGAITVIAGLITRKWGPGIGGLFLAFPAIFPASATLVEQQEREKKQRRHLRGEKRARDMAAADATGAAIGSLGLITFAALCWCFFPRYPSWLVLVGGTCAWAVVSVSAWLLRKRCRRGKKKRAQIIEVKNG
jgi:hypothetical protein